MTDRLVTGDNYRAFCYSYAVTRGHHLTSGGITEGFFYWRIMMTVREIAGVSGVSVSTVRRTAETKVGFVFESGKAATFTEKESIEIMREIKKKGFIQPIQNEAEPIQSEAVSRIDRLESMMEKMIVMVGNSMLAFQEQPKQIEMKQDYFSIKGYMNKINVQVTYSEAMNLGRVASKVSREQEKEIKQVEDERFGRVNSYHVDVLKEVFSL